MYCVAQWTQLVIITSILEKYYGVSTLAVYWTSMIYMVIIKMMMKMLRKNGYGTLKVDHFKMHSEQ